MGKGMIRWGKTFVFLLIFLSIFSLLQELFVEKTSYWKWKNYNRQEAVDVLVLGNSHADNALAPYYMAKTLSEMEEENIHVFNFSVYGMRMEQMYFFAKDILKIHTPDLIVIETYAFCPLADEHREILARRAFDVMPLTVNKIRGIQYSILEDNKWSYYIPFMKYHTRWKELRNSDFRLIFDDDSVIYSGVGTPNEFGQTNPPICADPGDNYFGQDTALINEQRELTETEKECLEKILELLGEKHIPLLFVSVPYKRQLGLNSIEQIKINNYIRDKYVNDDTVQMLDMNRMWKELDISYNDLVDEGHVNYIGAEKATKCLLQYMEENYDLDSILK